MALPPHAVPSRRRRHRRGVPARARRAVAVVAVVATVLGVAAAPSSPAGRRWAPVSRATIRPGAQLVIDGAQCTANFVFADDRSVYLGTAAHCAARGAATETNGCRAATLPLGTSVAVEGARHPGRLAYSSWRTMQAVGERRAYRCETNDFALVRLDRRDVARVNPSLPHWGGPTGLATGARAGSPVYGYGSSSLRLGLDALSPKAGRTLGTYARGWAHGVYTVTPGIPGDSGSGVLDSSGRALGVLSTLSVAPFPAENSYSDLRRALWYVRARTGLDEVRLAVGTVRFDRRKLPVGAG